MPTVVVVQCAAPGGNRLAASPATPPSVDGPQGHELV